MWSCSTSRGPTLGASHLSPVVRSSTDVTLDAWTGSFCLTAAEYKPEDGSRPPRREIHNFDVLLPKENTITNFGLAQAIISLSCVVIRTVDQSENSLYDVPVNTLIWCKVVCHYLEIHLVGGWSSTVNSNFGWFKVHIDSGKRRQLLCMH